VEQASVPVACVNSDEPTARPDKAPGGGLDAGIAAAHWSLVLSADVIACFRAAPDPKAIVRFMSDAILVESYNRIGDEPDHPLCLALRAEMDRRGLNL